MTSLLRAQWRQPRWLSAAPVLVLIGLVWAPARTPTTIYQSVGFERGETSAHFVGVAIDAAMLTVNRQPVPITLVLPDDRPRPTLTVTSPSLDSRFVQVEHQWPETFDWQAADPLPSVLRDSSDAQPG